MGSKLQDVSGSMGLRGELDNGFTYDLSATAGRNSLQFNIDNVPNPSMGRLSPTTFDNLGKRIQSEVTLNADFSYPFEIDGLASPLNVAGGVEWHRENFTVVPGEPASYEAGVLADQGFLIGEEAYPGYSPTFAGDFNRSNVAFYLDVEADITDNLMFGTAVRYEDFTDMGSKATYKATTLFNATEWLGLRGSVATGFHAPTPGQQQFSALTTELTDEGSLIESGVIPPTSPVAMAVGGEQLKPETSRSFTLGAVIDTDFINLTIDYYNIKMDDRLTQSQSYSLSDAQRDALIAEGFNAATGLGTFRFFTNDFSSKTEGVDVVATIPMYLTDTGNSSIVVAGNYSKTKVTSFNPDDPTELLSEGRVQQLEDTNPSTQGSVTVKHSEEGWNAYARLNYYGSYTDLHLYSTGLLIDVKSQVTLDINLGVNVSENIEISVGADNVLDSMPTENPWAFIVGAKYPTTAPAGIMGGFYYGRVRVNF